MIYYQWNSTSVLCKQSIIGLLLIIQRAQLHDIRSVLSRIITNVFFYLSRYVLSFFVGWQLTNFKLNVQCQCCDWSTLTICDQNATNLCVIHFQSGHRRWSLFSDLIFCFAKDEERLWIYMYVLVKNLWDDSQCFWLVTLSSRVTYIIKLTFPIFITFLDMIHTGTCVVVTVKIMPDLDSEYGTTLA